MQQHLYCKNCNEPIPPWDEEYAEEEDLPWTDGKNTYCTMECLARYYGSAVEDTYEETIKKQ